MACFATVKKDKGDYHDYAPIFNGAYLDAETFHFFPTSAHH
jgi:hypothetical protein